MNKIVFSFGLFFLTVIMSCSTDFDITGDWKEVGIVYGLFDQSDAAHYVKINKAFLDENTSALETALIADSVYYQDSLNVVVEEYNSSGVWGNVYTLSMVDGNTEVGLKDPGVFVNSPNYLYKLSTPLNEDNRYKLIITNVNSGKVISGETTIINDFLVLVPFPATEMNLIPGLAYSFKWRSAKNAKAFGLTFRFIYDETIGVTPTITKEIEWVLFTKLTSSNTDGGELLQFTIEAADFYKWLTAKIPIDPSATRTLQNIELDFVAGTEDLNLFIDVEENQSGLTADQIQPNYTNLSGDALGIFSSRYNKSVLGLTLTPQALDSLSNSSITSALGF